MQFMNLFGTSKNNKEKSKCSTKAQINLTPLAPIQDSEGNLTFSLDNHTYTLNVNSEEERTSVLAQINFHSVYLWDWFKEETGEEHWVLYNTDMYEEAGVCLINYLTYKENSPLIPVIPINATSCHLMFACRRELTTLDLSEFDTSNIVDMGSMFSLCSNLTTLDLSGFRTDKVTTMNKMFEYCKSLTELDLSAFNTSNVIDMEAMFCACSSLHALNISSFITLNVIDMSAMFEHCSSLIELDLSNFETPAIENMAKMFMCCESLISLNISRFTTNIVLLTTKLLDGCNSIEYVQVTDSRLRDCIKEVYPQIQLKG